MAGKEIKTDVINDTGNVFRTLMQYNPNDYVEIKGTGKYKLKYISWAHAWAMTKQSYPEASYIVHGRTTEFGPCNYFTDGRTCWVETEVIIPYKNDAGIDKEIHQTETLPVMDHRNQPILLDKVTSFDVNTAIKRCVTKALGLCGFGLGVYINEDLLYLDENGEIAKGSQTADQKKIQEAKEKRTNEPNQTPKANTQNVPAQKQPEPNEPEQQEDIPITKEQLKTLYSITDEALVFRIKDFMRRAFNGLQEYEKLTAIQCSGMFEVMRGAGVL